VEGKVREKVSMFPRLSLHDIEKLLAGRLQSLNYSVYP
jgi:hypothetical protein